MSSKHLSGIHVHHCKNTSGLSIIPMPVPEKVYIPMSQHIGAPCSPVVSVGDHVKVGQLIGDSRSTMSAPIHSSVSGEVIAIEKSMTQSGAVDTSVVIKADGNQEISETVVPPVVEGKKSFLAAVRASGLVGLGGAAFPTHVKYNPKNPKQIDTFVVNGAECEPYITVDEANMISHGRDLIEGALSVMKWLGIPRTIIAVEDNKPEVLKYLRQLALKHPNISVAKLRSSYPQGAERVIIYETTGRVLEAGKLPADVGVIVSNCTTVIKLAQFLATGMPLVSKSITVDGNIVAEPKNLEVPIGTPISEVIEYAGGVTGEVSKILLGGPMMGKAIPSDEYAIVKSNNAVLVFDKSFGEKLPETACISCGRCVAACPMRLMPAVLSKAYKHKDIETLNKYSVNACMDCGSCSYVCPARKPLNLEIKQGKALVKKAQEGGTK